MVRRDYGRGVRTPALSHVPPSPLPVTGKRVQGLKGSVRAHRPLPGTRRRYLLADALPNSAAGRLPALHPAPTRHELIHEALILSLLELCRHDCLGGGMCASRGGHSSLFCCFVWHIICFVWHVITITSNFRNGHRP